VRSASSRSGSACSRATLRRCWKKSCSTPAHSSASTPPCTCRAVVQPRLRKEIEHRARRARLRIGRAEHHPRQPRMQHGARTHRAGLERDEQLAAIEPVVAQRGGTGAQRVDLGMGAGVVRATGVLRPVAMSWPSLTSTAPTGTSPASAWRRASASASAIQCASSVCEGNSVLIRHLARLRRGVERVLHLLLDLLALRAHIGGCFARCRRSGARGTEGSGAAAVVNCFFAISPTITSASTRPSNPNTRISASFRHRHFGVHAEPVHPHGQRLLVRRAGAVHGAHGRMRFLAVLVDLDLALQRRHRSSKPTMPFSILSWNSSPRSRHCCA
jgi:hypothetical protein